MTGIQPQEFFFHCMAGREGLIDTAVKTRKIDNFMIYFISLAVFTLFGHFFVTCLILMPIYFFRQFEKNYRMLFRHSNSPRHL